MIRHKRRIGEQNKSINISVVYSSQSIHTSISFSIDMPHSQIAKGLQEVPAISKQVPAVNKLELLSFYGLGYRMQLWITPRLYSQFVFTTFTF